MAESSKVGARARKALEDKAQERPSTIFSEWPFPTDRHGVTSKIRREVQNAMSRTNGLKDKCDTVEATLESLLEWVRARRIDLEEVHAARINRAETGDA